MTKSEVELRVDPSRCVLCGGPNDCAAVGARTAKSGGPGNPAAAPCWCLTKTFPKLLLDQATKIDNAQACICQNCLTAD